MGFWLSRYGLTLIALITSVGGFQVWKLNYKHKIQHETKAEITDTSKKEGKKLNDQATKARAKSLSLDDPTKRLRKQYCRDCP